MWLRFYELEWDIKLEDIKTEEGILYERTIK